MNTQSEWVQDLLHRHDELMQFAARLNDEELLTCGPGRWNAGQHLRHVHLCPGAISQALKSRAFIEQTFGYVDRPLRSYDEVIAIYRSGLEQGGRAPERYEPGPFGLHQKTGILNDLRALLQQLRAQLVSYEDADLDSLVLPHPFVGKLTIREFIYLLTGHATIHQHSIQRELAQLKTSGAPDQFRDSCRVGKRMQKLDPAPGVDVAVRVP